VFCPSCSSHNQDEVKFCTRCGTNLGVVSDALGGRLARKSGATRPSNANKIGIVETEETCTAQAAALTIETK
jgi:uncharacterized membrane protein YvbJ